MLDDKFGLTNARSSLSDSEESGGHSDDPWGRPVCSQIEEETGGDGDGSFFDRARRYFFSFLWNY